jgi:hypothetical protein
MVFDGSVVNESNVWSWVCSVIHHSLLYSGLANFWVPQFVSIGSEQSDRDESFSISTKIDRTITVELR